MVGLLFMSYEVIGDSIAAGGPWPAGGRRPSWFKFKGPKLFFWIPKVFVSFGSRRFSYLLSFGVLIQNGFRIFWIRKVFVSFGAGRFPLSFPPKMYQSPSRGPDD